MRDQRRARAAAPVVPPDLVAPADFVGSTVVRQLDAGPPPEETATYPLTCLVTDFG